MQNVKEKKPRPPTSPDQRMAQARERLAPAYDDALARFADLLKRPGKMGSPGARVNAMIAPAFTMGKLLHPGDQNPDAARFTDQFEGTRSENLLRQLLESVLVHHDTYGDYTPEELPLEEVVPDAELARRYPYASGQPPVPQEIHEEYLQPMPYTEQPGQQQPIQQMPAQSVPPELQQALFHALMQILSQGGLGG